jgi:hypothetical protein
VILVLFMANFFDPPSIFNVTQWNNGMMERWKNGFDLIGIVLNFYTG